MTEYLDLAANQTSPQEVDNNQYMVNAVDFSKEDDSFDFDLG